MESIRGYEVRPVAATLDLLCAGHRYRNRDQFAFDPWQRAMEYLDRFPGPGGRLGFR